MTIMFICLSLLLFDSFLLMEYSLLLIILIVSREGFNMNDSVIIFVELSKYHWINKNLV